MGPGTRPLDVAVYEARHVPKSGCPGNSLNLSIYTLARMVIEMLQVGHLEKQEKGSQKACPNILQPPYFDFPEIRVSQVPGTAAEASIHERPSNGGPYEKENSA